MANPVLDDLVDRGLITAYAVLYGGEALELTFLDGTCLQVETTGEGLAFQNTTPVGPPPEP